MRGEHRRLLRERSHRGGEHVRLTVIEGSSSEKILKAGQAAGLAVNFHAEELHQIGGAEMGARIMVGEVYLKPIQVRLEPCRISKKLVKRASKRWL